jgi:hypothetical protein
VVDGTILHSLSDLAFDGGLHAGDAQVGIDAGSPVVVDGTILHSLSDLVRFGQHDHMSPPDQTEGPPDVLQAPKLVADDGAALLAPPSAPSFPLDEEPAMPVRFGESNSDAGHHSSDEPAEGKEEDPATS